MQSTANLAARVRRTQLRLLRHSIAAVAAYALSSSVAAAAQSNTVDFASLVDTRIGTKGKGAPVEKAYLENGQTNLGASVPFGMVQFTPTNYSPRLGFVVNQLSGAGCANMGNFPTRPILGPLKISPGDMQSVSFSARLARVIARWIHQPHDASPNDNEGSSQTLDATAGYFRTRLTNGVVAELSATTRTGMSIYHFPRSSSSGTVLIGTGVSATSVSTSTVRILDRRRLEASATGGSFCGVETPYTIYLVAEFDRDAMTDGTWEGDQLREVKEQTGQVVAGAFFTFDTRAQSAVRYKFALSYVSIENARLNLAKENPTWDFANVKQRARDMWNDYLSRIRVSPDDPDRVKQFYTHFYHALLHPSIANDVNGEYIGADGRVHTSSGRGTYTAIGSWDAYRTQIQLLSLVAHNEASDIVSSLVTFAEQSGGGLPKWLLANCQPTFEIP